MDDAIGGGWKGGVDEGWTVVDHLRVEIAIGRRQSAREIPEELVMHRGVCGRSTRDEVLRGWRGSAWVSIERSAA